MIKEPPEGDSLQADGAEKMNKGDDIYALHNFEFLAITFAQMAAQGRTVDLDTVPGIWMKHTGNGSQNVTGTGWRYPARTRSDNEPRR